MQNDLPIYLLVSAVLLTALATTALVYATFNGIGRPLPRISGITLTGHPDKNLRLHDTLDVALDEAAKANAFRIGVHDGVIPMVSMRYTPTNYEDALGEIVSNYTAGHAISIDFAHLDQHRAVRLADFCSGLAAGSCGWIFRVTDMAIVLTPISEQRI